MRRDLKTGMLFGVVLVIGTIVIMSVWPGAGVESGLIRSRTVVVDETVGERVRSAEGQVVSAPAEPEAIEERRVEEPRVAVEQPDGGVGVEVEEVRNRQVESPSVEEEEMQIHVVAGGETLSSISVMYYGSGRQWRRIVDANPKVITDENRLQPGMRLVIPR